MFIVVCQHVYQKYFIKDSSSLPKRRREDFEQYLNNADFILESELSTSHNWTREPTIQSTDQNLNIRNIRTYKRIF